MYSKPDKHIFMIAVFLMLFLLYDWLQFTDDTNGFLKFGEMAKSKKS